MKFSFERSENISTKIFDFSLIIGMKFSNCLGLNVGANNLLLLLHSLPELINKPFPKKSSKNRYSLCLLIFILLLKIN